MATTFSVRAGSSFRAQVEYRNPPTPPDTDPAEGALVDTSAVTARLQIRAANGSRRVIMSVTESTQANAILTPLTGWGRWTIALPASATRALPSVAYLEMELVADGNPEDVTFLFSGALRVTPELVAS